ncbi:ABC transporter ATPase [Marmoricola endophyticus]|uniref:ABC transporter ATPase n=1 Tax=Marmoricola endophyticus TaxID=2040280 RepID=A0A917BF18_9ACTN|nr:AAA family ATPase [Marmoricola endophyticus]GGF41095.1 ABC transporter ATPase [Marmoricola endophyticus]
MALRGPGHELAVRRFRANDDVGEEWPRGLPAVEQVLREGFDVTPGVTLLFGENGAGKSTLVEAFAMRFGLGPEGGSSGAEHTTYATESPLHSWLSMERGPGGPRWGFFLRAESMHGFYTYLAENPGSNPHEPDFHALSHGESFLSVLSSRFDSAGFYALDEPEAALSFSGQMALLGTMHDLARAGAQLVCATHSPLLAALPGARLLEVGEWGIRETTYDDLPLVALWRDYLAEPQRFLRHVLEG